MLEGSLDSFTLPDIFQLLAFTSKSGCLRLQQDDRTGRVYFRDGEVIFAVSSSGGIALGRRLVGAGLVTTGMLEKALAEQDARSRDGHGLRLGQILMDEGAITETALETFVREQIQDAVFDLMRWSEGSFEFLMGSDEAAIDEPITLSVTTENLIMEGSRRLEEWENVRRKIPSSTAVVAMAPTPGDQGVEVSLKPEEWRLLALVDGRRTVGDLVSLFGQGEFQTGKTLYGLVGAGLLEVRDPDLEGPPSISALLAQQELLRQLEGGEPLPSSGSAAAEPAQPPEPTGGVAGADEDVTETAHLADDEIAQEEPEPDAEEDVVTEPTSEPDAPAQDRQLTTDPDIDADLVQRLIAGVKEL